MKNETLIANSVALVRTDAYKNRRIQIDIKIFI